MKAIVVINNLFQAFAAIVIFSNCEVISLEASEVLVCTAWLFNFLLYWTRDESTWITTIVCVIAMLSAYASVMVDSGVTIISVFIHTYMAIKLNL